MLHQQQAALAFIGWLLATNLQGGYVKTTGRILNFPITFPSAIMGKVILPSSYRAAKFVLLHNGGTTTSQMQFVKYDAGGAQNDNLEEEMVFVVMGY